MEVNNHLLVEDNIPPEKHVPLLVLKEQCRNQTSCGRCRFGLQPSLITLKEYPQAWIGRK